MLTSLTSGVVESVSGRPPPHTRRIIGGSAVSDRHKYPWYAQLSRVGGRSTGCGMTLISPTWAVTACHCVIKGDYSGYHTGAGSEITYGCTSLSGPDCITQKIKRWVPHPCYAISCCDDHDDLCLAELEEPVNLHSFPHIAGLNGTAPLPTGSAVRLIGMGATRHHGKGSLRELEVNTVSRARCEEQEPMALQQNKINFSNVICTGGTAGKDSCNGDSGSPMVGCWDTGENDTSTWVLGVLVKGSQLPVNGPPCGADGRLSVYTRIELYADFIRSTMEGSSFTCSHCHNGGGSSCTRTASPVLPLVRCASDSWTAPSSFSIPNNVLYSVAGILLVVLCAGCCIHRLASRCREPYDQVASVELDISSSQAVGPGSMDDAKQQPAYMEVEPAREQQESPVWEPARHPTLQEMKDIETVKLPTQLPRSISEPNQWTRSAARGSAHVAESEAADVDVSTEVQQAWSLLNAEDEFDGDVSTARNKAYELY